MNQPHLSFTTLLIFITAVGLAAFDWTPAVNDPAGAWMLQGRQPACDHEQHD